ERIVGDSRALDLLEQPIRARLADSQTVLRGYDLAAGLAGGDAGYAADMDLAARNLAAVEGVVDRLPQNLDPATVDAITGFSDAVRLGYEASIEAPRAPANRLGDLQLPSTGAADLALAMRANLGYDYIATLVRSENSPFVNQDGSDFTPDQISDVAATWVYDRRPGSAAELARLDATPGNAQQALDLLLGLPDDPGYADRRENYLRQINHSGLIRDAASILSEGEQGRLRDAVDEADPVSVGGFFRFILDGAHLMQSESVRWYNRQVGTGTDDFWRNAGRGGVTLVAGVWGSPGLILGGGGVELQNRAKYDGWLTTVAAGSPVTFPFRSLIADADPTANPESRPARRPRETDVEYYTRLNPLTGGMIRTPLDHSYNRWLGDGDVSDDYHDRPVESFMEDALPVMILAGPISAGMRASAVSAASRAAVARSVLADMPAAAARGAQGRAVLSEALRLEGRAAQLDVASRVSGAALTTATVPFRVITGPVRATAGAVRAVAVPTAHLAQRAATAAGYRAIGNAIVGAPTRGWAATAGGLTATAGRLGRVAETA
ncbi:MAG TPA: hypothetical protein VEZ42_05595, partial [Pseudonocardia sp.]|nr:hypothetical protein [Pseudonocardia sp.]